MGVVAIYKGIRRVLEITHGNKLQAGKILDIDRDTLYRKLGR
jgi:transcriptional regulator of acetoin/glycerol metabolism